MTLVDKTRKYAANELRYLKWLINHRISKTITARTKQGLFTVFSSDPEIGRQLCCLGEYELDLTMKVQRFLRNHHKPLGGTILDIGANMGVISIGMLNNKLADRAIAIEPDPLNFSLLKHNVKQNKLEGKVICIQKAVSNVRSKVEFELCDGNFGDRRVRANHELFPELYQESTRHTIEVEADCLDKILETLPEEFQDIRLIWIDTQGHEGQVFLGGKQTFSRDISVEAEIWPYGIRRSGMSNEQFFSIAKDLWSSYWVIRRGRFFQYPISLLYLLFDELGEGHNFENVIFTR